MKSYFSIFIVLILFVTVMYSMATIGVIAESKNNALDDNSKNIIGNLTTSINNDFNINSSFSESELEINGSGFDQEDVFAQQFFEGKADSTKKAGVISSLVKAPDTILLSFGLPEEDVATFKNIILLFIGTVISFATYRAIFGGGKVTDN